MVKNFNHNKPTLNRWWSTRRCDLHLLHDDESTDSDDGKRASDDGCVMAEWIWRCDDSSWKFGNLLGFVDWKFWKKFVFSTVYNTSPIVFIGFLLGSEQCILEENATDVQAKKSGEFVLKKRRTGGKRFVIRFPFRSTCIQKTFLAIGYIFHLQPKLDTFQTQISFFSNQTSRSKKK